MQIQHRNADGTPRYTNHLAGQTSPYLQKHAHDPVEWYPWGEAALARAKRENKPIHLSVGYASCHWCSVKHQESFADETLARLLNEHFINIKVDREERPDIDRIYQIAQQMLTQRSGGWPLTMFLTPEDQRPFFGGTYFPKEARYGLPAFRDILQRVAQFYREHGGELRTQNEALMEAFAQLNPPPASPQTPLSDEPLRRFREQLQRSFDPQYGGFGGAPKFPQPQMLNGLLRGWHATSTLAEPDLQALYMATLTLRRMAAGGINDQLGGGFCRYSVDERWMIPHFEKMLYDDGALLAVYAQAASATGDAEYAEVARSIAAWARREMCSAEGAYFSSLDADSEGHEGKFYVWQPAAVRAVLTEAEFAVAAPHFGLDQPPNFEGDWHLYVARSIEEIAREQGRAAEEVAQLLQSARRKLLAVRAQRVRPARDDKILTSWNALMIRGLAIAARALQSEELLQEAQRTLAFVRAHLWRDGRLLATCMDGRAHLSAYLDDYAYLADAILELQQARFSAEQLQFARELLEVLLKHFADPVAGGFFFTADDHEALIHRVKSFSDDATPAGNGIAASVLLRFGHLLGESRYLAAAEGTLRAAWPALSRYPQAHASMVAALAELREPAEIIILRGGAEEIEAWRRELMQAYAPQRLVLAIPAEAQGLPEALATKAARGAAVGYLCRGSSCSAPITSRAELAAQLRPAGGAAQG